MSVLNREKLKEDGDLYRLLVENVVDYAIFVLDAEGYIASWNTGAERIKGYKANEIIGQHFSRFYPTEAVDRRWPEHELQVAAEQGRFEDEGWRIRKDGSQFWANVVITALRDESGSLLGFAKITRDLTARKQAEETARHLEAETAARRVAEQNAKIINEQRERLQITLASIGDAVISTDSHGHVQFLNPAAEQLVGWTTTEAMGRMLESVFRIINEETRLPVENPALRALRDGTVVGLANHTLLISKDGNEQPIDDSAAPIRDSQGNCIGSILVFRDISERRRAEQYRNARLAASHAMTEALSASEAAKSLLKAVCQNLDWEVGFFWKPTEDYQALKCAESWSRPDSTVTDFIAASCSRRFFNGDGLPGRTWESGSPQWILDITRDSNFPRQASAAQHGLHSAFACPVAIAGRMHGIIEFFTKRIRNPDEDLLELMPSVAALLAQFIERKSAESDLRQSEQELADFFESATVGLHWVSPDGIIIKANRAETDMLGYSREEYVGRPIADFHVDKDVSRDILNRLHAGDRLSNCPARLRCKDGSIKDVMIDSSVLFRNGEFVHTRCFTRDVTAQKRSEQTSQFLADASAALSVVVDFESTLQKVASLAVPGFADWATVDVLGSDGQLCRLAASHVDPAKMQLAQELDKRFPPDPSSPRGVWAVLRTGKPELVPKITEEMLTTSIKDNEFLKIVRELGLKSYIGVPLRIRGQTLGVLTFIVAESGHTYDFTDLAVAEDLASRAAIAIENSRLYGELREADCRKDEFLAILAHELRNPLAPIRNGLHVLELAGGGGEMADEARKMMGRQLGHMVRLVDDLLDISRITRNKMELRKECVALTTVIHNALEASLPLIERSGHTFSLTLTSTPVHLDADPVRLAQVFSNLLNNAAKYTESGGQISLTAEIEGGMVAVRVKDSGIGIPTESLSRIFEMFSQVDRNIDRAQGGLGIGLTLVRRLTEMHGGSVEATSDGPGCGSVFTVRLPIQITNKSDLPDRAIPENVVATKQRRILIVDDNRDGAQSLSMMLRLMGNEVRRADDGLMALEVADEYRPDVILLDIGLPKLNGYDVCRRIRQYPWAANTIIVALTGWGQEEDRRRSQEAGFDDHLIKPLDVNELMRLIERSRAD